MAEEKTNKGWFSRLSAGLKKTSQKLTDGLNGIIHKRKLDQETLEELEELLIAGDMGAAAAASIIQALASERFNQEVSPEELKHYLARQITQRLAPYAQTLDVRQAKPFVILVVGVNGGGKTTTIGKLSHHYTMQGLNVKVAACDTFRAAAVAQLREWTKRAGVELIQGQLNQDPAGVAYTALEHARDSDTDVLLIDTAGRLQNKQDLMDELAKIERVIKKLIPNAPHATLLVLDATTGQNAHQQVTLFRQTVKLDGLIMTKLDGTAKGGVLVALADKHQLPIYAIGVGEQVDDLRPFTADAYAHSLVGLPS